MELTRVKKISDIIYYISIALAVIVIGENYYDRWRLPEGVCPVNNNYPMIIFAIGLLVVTFIVTTVVDRKVKKQAAVAEKAVLVEEEQSEDKEQSIDKE